MYIAEMNGTGTCQYQDKHLKADEAAYLNGCSVCFVPECMLNEERLIEYHTQGGEDCITIDFHLESEHGETSSYLFFVYMSISI